LNFSTALGPRWSAGLEDSLTVTGDLGTFSALSGVSSVQGINSLFSPVATGRSLRTNRVDGDLTWALDQNSSVSFRVAHNLRKYGSGALSSGFLSDQQQYQGSVTFQQRLGVGDSWSLGYTSTYFDRKNSTDTLSQSAQAGYALHVGRDMTMHISAGLSQVNNQGSSGGYLGYDATALLEKTLVSNRFSVGYTQDSKESIGIGSNFTTRRATLDWDRAFGKITASASASVYDSKGTLNNGLRVRGVRASGNVGYPITRTLSISGGATYQSTRKTGIFDFTQERVFFSLRYSEPNLKRFH